MHRCRASREIRAFCILYAYMNHDLAYIRRRSKVNRDPAHWRREEPANSTCLWRGSCIEYIMNAQLKIVGIPRRYKQIIASRRCANWFCARVTLSPRIQVFPALLPVAQRSLDLCSLISGCGWFCISVSFVQQLYDSKIRSPMQYSADCSC